MPELIDKYHTSYYRQDRATYPCEICGGTITYRDSCECGTTMQELTENAINERDLDPEN